MIGRYVATVYVKKRRERRRKNIKERAPPKYCLEEAILINAILNSDIWDYSRAAARGSPSQAIGENTAALTDAPQDCSLTFPLKARKSFAFLSPFLYPFPRSLSLSPVVARNTKRKSRLNGETNGFALNG